MHGHHRRNVCTMGRFQELRCTAGNECDAVSAHVRLANAADGVLLLQNYLHANPQGWTFYHCRITPYRHGH